MPSNEKWKVEIVGTPLDVNECVQIVSEDCAGAIEFCRRHSKQFHGKSSFEIRSTSVTPL